MNLIASKKSIDLLIFAEVSSKAYYEKFLIHPTWPGGESGVTIGIGADLGQMSKDVIISDWHDQLSVEDLKTIISVAGLKGAAAASALAKTKKVIVTYDSACNVFYKRSLPKFAKMTLGIYPGLELLEPDAVGALISMIYNRGAALTGKNREEMNSIVHLVPQKDYAGIAAMVSHSKRIWTGKKGMEGIVARRTAEANYIANAVHSYDSDELVIIPV